MVSLAQSFDPYVRRTPVKRSLPRLRRLNRTKKEAANCPACAPESSPDSQDEETPDDMAAPFATQNP